MLATLDARGLFTFVDARRAGSLGDAFTCSNSQLVKKVEDHRLLNEQIRKVGNTSPYIVGDSAFAKSQTLVKGFPYPLPSPLHGTHEYGIQCCSGVYTEDRRAGLRWGEEKVQNHFSSSA